METTDLLNSLQKHTENEKSLKAQFQTKLFEFNTLCQQQTASFLSPHLQIPLNISEHFYQEAHKNIKQSDYDKTLQEELQQLQNNLNVSDLNKKQLRDLQIDFFSAESEKPKNLPPLPPFYADIVQSELVASAQPPVPCAGALLQFMIQDNLNFYQELQNYERAFFFQLLSSPRQNLNINEIKTHAEQIQQNKTATSQLISKLLSTAAASRVEVAEIVIRKAQEVLGNQLTNAEESCVTVSEFRRTMLHNNQQMSVMEQIYSQLKFLSLSRRKELVQRAHQKASKLIEVDDDQEQLQNIITNKDLQFIEENGVVLNNIVNDSLENLVVALLTCKQFNELYKDDIDFDLFFQQKENVQLKQLMIQLSKDIPEHYNYNSIIQQAVTNIQSQEKIYGRNITRELLCSKLYQLAQQYFNSMSQYIPNFAASGLRNFDKEDVFDIIESANQFGQKYVLKNINLSILEKHNEFETFQPSEQLKQQFKQFYKVFKPHNDVQKNQKQQKAQYIWKDSLRAFDIKQEITLNQEISVLFGLISSVSPQERDHLSKKLIEKAYGEKQQILLDHYEECDVSNLQMLQTVEYVRFVDLNKIYSDMCITCSKIFVVIQQLINQIKYCEKQNQFKQVNNQQGQNQANDKTRQNISGNQVPTDSALDFDELLEKDEFQQQGMELNHLFLEFINIKNFKQKLENEYYINENMVAVDIEGNYIVFQEAVQYINDLIYEDHQAITNYVDRSIAMMRHDYLCMLLFNNNRFKVKNRDQDTQAIIKQMTDEQIFESLDEQEKLQFQDVQFEKFIDTSLIVHQILQSENKLLFEKFKCCNNLYRSCSSTCQKEIILNIYNQMIECFVKRPENFIEYSTLPTIFQDSKVEYVQYSLAKNPVDYMCKSIKQINNPCVLINYQYKSMQYFNASMETLLELQRGQLQNFQTKQVNIGQIPMYVDIQKGIYGYEPSLITISKLYQLQNIIEQEVLQVFVQETYPKCFQQICTRENGTIGYLNYKSYVAKQGVCIRASIGEILLEEIIGYVKQYKNTADELFILPENIRHLGQIGVLTNNTCIDAIIEESCAELKIKYDKEQKFQEQETTYAHERMIGSILGLLCPTNTGIQSIYYDEQGRVQITVQNEPDKKLVGAQTDVLSRVLSFRDLYALCDTGKRQQLDQYTARCNYTIFEGVGALPLPFSSIAILLNHLWARRLFTQALLEQHALRLTSIRAARHAQIAEVSENQIVMFARFRLGYQLQQKDDYRTFLGPKCLNNNLPYFATVDQNTFKYLFQEYDPLNMQTFKNMIVQTEFGGNVSDKQVGFRDVISTTDDNNQFPLFSELLPIQSGIFARTAFAETTINQIKLTTFRSGIFGYNYCIINQIINGSIRESEVQSDQPHFEIFDQFDFFKNYNDRFAQVKYQNAKYTTTQSTLYYINPEDFLQSLNIQLQQEYFNKIKQYQQKEISDQTVFCISQSLIYSIILKQSIEEVKRNAYQAQIKSYLSIIRTYLCEIQSDQLPIMLETSPQFRGVQFPRSEGQQNGFLFGSNSAIEHVNSIPHPSLVIFDQYSDQQLEIILVFVICLESVIRYQALKHNLLGKSIYSIGDDLANMLEFIFEIQHIKLNEKDAGELVIPSRLYLEKQDVEYLEKQIKLKLDINLNNYQQFTTLDDNPDKWNEVNQNLENAKIYLLVQKSIQLRDCCETVVLAGYVQCCNNSDRRSLLQQQHYYEKLIRDHCRYTGSSAKLYGFKLDDYFQKIIDRTERRILSENTRSSISSQQPQISGLHGFDYQDSFTALHIANNMLLEQNKQQPVELQQHSELFVCSETSAPGMFKGSQLIVLQYLVHQKQNGNGIGDIQNFITKQKLGIRQLDENHRTKHSVSAKPYPVQSAAFASNAYMYFYQFYAANSFDYHFSALGCGTDGSRGCYAHHGVDQSFLNFDQQKPFSSALSATLTQLELDSIYLASIIKQVKQNDQLQNQWAQFKYQLILSQKVIELDKLETLLNTILECDRDSSVLSPIQLLGREAAGFFKQAFDQFRAEMPQPSLLQTVNNQEIEKKLIMKKEQQYQALNKNFFLFLEEEQLDQILLQKHIQHIKESTHFFRFAFAEAIYSTLRQFIQTQILQKLSNVTNTISMKMNKQKQFSAQRFGVSNDIFKEYIQFLNQSQQGQLLTEKLSKFCKKTPELNPYHTNVSAIVTPQILNVFIGILQLEDYNQVSANGDQYLNGQKLSATKQMLKILTKQDIDTQYLNVVVNQLSNIEQQFNSFSALNVFFKVRSTIENLVQNQNAEKNLKIKYGNQFQQYLVFQFDGLTPELNFIYKDYYSQVKMQNKVFYTQQQLKFQNFYSKYNLNLNIQYNQTKPQLEQLQCDMKLRSIAQLNPQANEYVKDIDILQKELHFIMTNLIQAEDICRQRIHSMYHNKFVTILQNILQLKQQQATLAFELTEVKKLTLEEVVRNYATQKHTLELKTTYSKLSVEEHKNLDFVRNHFKAIITNDTSTEVEVFSEERGRIIEQYQQSIQVSRNNLADIKVKTLMSRNYLNYLYKTKQSQVNEIAEVIGQRIADNARLVWQNLGEIECVDKQLEQQVLQITQILAEKTSNVQRMKNKLDFTQKRSKSAKSGLKQIQENALGIIKKALYAETTKKTLPVLSNQAVNKANKICNEGEREVINYRQNLLKLEKLRQLKQQLQNTIKINTQNFHVEHKNLVRDIQKENDIINQAGRRRDDISVQNKELIQQVQLQERLLRDNAKMVEEGHVQQLIKEKNLIEAETIKTQTRINELMNDKKNKKLFEAVGDKIDEVLQQFDKINSNKLPEKQQRNYDNLKKQQ